MNKHTIIRSIAVAMAVLLLFGSIGGAAAADIYNPLEGKSLVAVGDSLTAGYRLEPDPQTGELPTYPVIVGNRNHMQVENLAINGAWMASARYRGVDVEGFSSYFTEEGFLPDEIDYLTLNFGANDWSYGLVGLMDDFTLEHYGTIYYESTLLQQTAAKISEDWSATYIGTPSDTGINTWWGAWNAVLRYLREYYPQTKVGILVPYPSPDVETEFSMQLRLALFEIAAAYGYPTIDYGDADQWFCVGYAKGLDPDIGDQIAMMYTFDGVHPNALGHEMMADGYEAWLRGL